MLDCWCMHACITISLILKINNHNTYTAHLLLSLELYTYTHINKLTTNAHRHTKQLRKQFIFLLGSGLIER